MSCVETAMEVLLLKERFALIAIQNLPLSKYCSISCFTGLGTYGSFTLIPEVVLTINSQANSKSCVSSQKHYL